MIDEYYPDSYLKKKFVHVCKLPNQETINIKDYYPNSCILARKLFALFLITNHVSRRRNYSKSQKVVEKERITHLKNYKYIIHPFSDFAYYFEIFMILVYFVQLSMGPILITLRSSNEFTIYFLFVTQLICCFNIFTSCYTGHYRTDIKEVILNQKDILRNALKSGNIIIELLGGFPAAFISSLCGASIVTEHLLSCLIIFNIFPLLRYLEILRQKRGFSFVICRLLNVFLVFIFGIFGLTALIYVSVRLDNLNENTKDNSKIWWCVYRTYAFMYGTEINEFCFVGFELLFATFAIIFGIVIRNVLLVQMIILCKTFYSTEQKRACLFKELNEFCHYKRLPFNLQERLALYYNFKLHNVYYNEAEIKKQLSENLRSIIQDYIYRSWFEADIFKLCPLALRQLITNHIEQEIYFKNDIIYETGDPFDYIYFIKSGSVLRIRSNANEIFRVPEGNFFSEKALLPNYHELHSSTAIATESCQILRLSRQNFLKLIENYQSSYDIILDILEKRKEYLDKGGKLKSHLRLSDFYQEIKTNND